MLKQNDAGHPLASLKTQQLTQCVRKTSMLTEDTRGYITSPWLEDSSRRPIGWLFKIRIWDQIHREVVAEASHGRIRTIP